MRTFLRAAVLLALSTAAFSTAAQAQFGVGASLTAQHITNLNSPDAPDSWIYGPTFSLQHEHGKVVKFGFDLRASFLNGNNVSVNSATIGPRLAFAAPKIHLKFYGEVLIGAMGVRPSAGRNRTGHLDFGIAAGVDHAITRHFDWRVLEYEYARVPDINGLSAEDTRNQLSTGILVHF